MTVSMRSSGLNGFVKNASAPARKASSRAVGVLFAVKMTMRVETKEGSARSARHTSKPSRPGIITSSTTTSGGRTAAIASASWPSTASSRSKLASWSTALRRLRTKGSSSTTSTRMRFFFAIVTSGSWRLIEYRVPEEDPSIVLLDPQGHPRGLEGSLERGAFRSGRSAAGEHVAGICFAGLIPPCELLVQRVEHVEERAALCGHLVLRSLKLTDDPPDLGLVETREVRDRVVGHELRHAPVRVGEV